MEEWLGAGLELYNKIGEEGDEEELHFYREDCCMVELLQQGPQYHALKSNHSKALTTK